MKRLKRPNSLFLQGEVSSAVLKTWKTRETKTRITQNFQILNHIQGTTIGKLTSRGFRKCGTFWVLKGSYWPSKSTDFENLGPLPKIRGVAKKRHGHNFDFSGLKRIAKVTHRVDYTCYSFQTRKLKIVAVLFFCNTSYFWWRTENFKVCWLWAAITPVEKLARPQSTSFSESSGRELSHGPIPEKFSLTKMSRRRGFSQKRFFCNFPLPPQEIFQVAANRTILILEGLPMAHLKAFVPYFQKHMWKRS